VTTPCSTTTTPLPRFLLLGDSHTGCVGRAARQAGLSFIGGPVGAGRDFLGPFFDSDGHSGRLLFRAPETAQLVAEFFRTLGTADFSELDIPLVCTFGLSAHTMATQQNWDIYRDQHGTVPERFLSSRLFADLIRSTVRGALAFYDHMNGLGVRVLAPLPPQRVPTMSDPSVFFAGQDVICAELVSRGVEIIDLRASVTDRSGHQRPAFCETNDTIHGNIAFGRLVVAELLDRGL
jgi:hypothetical protein